MGGSGAPFIGVSNFPPDERGRYVIGRGKIKLLYADGSRHKQTFGVVTNKRGRPSPQEEGVVLGGDYFIFNASGK